MNKRAFILALLLASFFYPARASHITGGEMYYTFLGVVAGEYRYSCTLKLFQRCQSGRLFPDPNIISVYDNATKSKIREFEVSLSHTENLRLTNNNPCISNPPNVCYDVAYYEFNISVPASESGYTIASQVNYRIDGISNLAGGSSGIGATYTAEIPGTFAGPDAMKNSSSQFIGNDLVIVCAGNNFNYSFAARDEDGDELHYSFGPAFNSTAGNNLPPLSPPYPSVPYRLPQYVSGSPLGSQVSINSSTGMITGIAPPEGIYVVTVTVAEFRNGMQIATQRKDLQIFIADCSIAAATLLPDYSVCGIDKMISLSNQSNSALIVTSDWDFSNASGVNIFHATTPIVGYSFPDTGTYRIKLSINRNQACSDSTESIVRVYPGFVPEFGVTGICIGRTTQFTDQSTSVYGQPNTWAWDFGEILTVVDTANTRLTSYSYPSVGPRNIRLIVTDTKGCRDTLVKSITIIDKPPILLAFKDTLICLHDQLQLQAGGTGIYSWSPAINLLNPNSANPIVSPSTTTKYYVDLNQDGCLNRDSVTIRVVDHVTLQVMNDTTICQGDEIRINIVSDGLSYTWSPGIQMADPTQASPTVVTNTTTTYEVQASIGSCLASDQVKITTVPYPLAEAGPDISICYNTQANLNGQTDGSSFLWSPVSSLDDPSILNPVAHPGSSTLYILSAYDDKGCPKPGIDSILVTVQPKIRAFAGADTTAVLGQPVELHASGGVSYTWSPAAYLSTTDIADPVAIFLEPSEGILFKVIVATDGGCHDSAFVRIKVFQSAPVVFVPSAFTPNGDGKNDLLRPIAAGIAQIEFFGIYNRWGQTVYATTTNGNGWDGKVNGSLQGPGTFVWMVKAKDYTGRLYINKGTVTLIR